MRISVIIPTYKRPRTLLQALRSLQEQTLPDFEIVVVDNAADSEVEKMVAEFNLTAKHLGCYVSEPQLGLHNARHTSSRVAKGDISVFTDDDAAFDPGWLQAYAKAFVEHHEMAAAGGPVRPIWEASPPKWLLEFMGDAKTFAILSLMEPYNESRLDPEGFFFGVNMAIRRNVLFEVGGFNPDSFGDFWLGDGEGGLNRKLWRQGMLVGYVPEALVYHHIPPQRMTVANVKRVGIRVLDADNVQILNNTLYNIFPEPNCDSACMEENMGIEVQNWQGSTENIVIKNNIVQTAHIGIGRYIWSTDYPVSIDSDYNLVFDSDFPFRGTITQNTHDRVMDPGLIDPQNHNFALLATSPARNSGTDLTSAFSIDNHDAADPRLPAITAPIIHTGVWDRGAYEYEETQPLVLLRVGQDNLALSRWLFGINWSVELMLDALNPHN